MSDIVTEVKEEQETDVLKMRLNAYAEGIMMLVKKGAEKGGARE